MNPRYNVPLVLLTQDMLPQCKDMYTEHRNKKFITGLIRGNYEDKRSPRWCRHVDLRIPTRDGIWVPIKEVLIRIFNEACPNEGGWGVGALIRLAKHDNKGRLQFRGPGPEDDKRAAIVCLPCYPLEVAAVQGHPQNIQDLSGMEPEELDAQIAVSWLCLKTNEELGEMEDASLRGVPSLAWEDCPRHLHHRTTKDAAISILNQGFKPGHRDSGKMHVYFADRPLEEMQHGTSGVRADHPVALHPLGNLSSTAEAYHHALDEIRRAASTLHEVLPCVQRFHRVGWHSRNCCTWCRILFELCMHFHVGLSCGAPLREAQFWGRSS